MMICNTLSAITRRKSPSLVFTISSASGSLSSVIGINSSVKVMRGNSTLPMSPLATEIETTSGGACPTRCGASISTGNYTTSSDANLKLLMARRERPIRLSLCSMLGRYWCVGFFVELFQAPQQ